MIEPHQSPKSSRSIWLPLLFAIVMALGMFIGSKLNSVNPNPSKIVLRNSGGKIEQLIKLVERRYVDTVDVQMITEQSLQDLLQQLDPYSSYIPAAHYEEVNQPLEGNFEGIGIEFYSLNDTVLVVSPISGGPSEQVGIRGGDKIVKVDGENIAGVAMSNDEIIKRLRGSKGSKVKVSVKRNGQSELLEFTITRDKIPIYSVDIAYCPAPTTAFIKVNKFSATTAEEFREAYMRLAKAGPIDKLILDLRGNPGGYLDAAIKLADEFLEDGLLITYTEGRSQPRRDFNASGRGLFEQGELIILIDEGSASASEIVSGAVQDWDRGIIMGRRSFGKGLVQEQFEMRDGSAVRLTVSRYYTPVGRSIQKPYTAGIRQDDFMERLRAGELFSADSIKMNDSLSYLTPGGRRVYGGGGIMPDLFVPADSNLFSDYFNALNNSGTLIQFCYAYADTHRAALEKFGAAANFVSSFKADEQLLLELMAFAKKEGIVPENKDWKRDAPVIRLYLKANIGRQVYGNDGFYPVVHQRDKAFQAALSYPEAP